MSRFLASNERGQKFSYGFDRPLQEYFLQVIEDGEPVEIVGSLGRRSGTNGNMLDALVEYGVEIPEEHKDRIIFDLPF
mgnify:CR=1 FL=1